MLVRIVRMTFRPDAVAAFLEIFRSSKDKIRAFEGCQHLELLRDLDQPTVFITHSHWTGPEALEKYRQSALFQQTWAATKLLFADRPLAFSGQQVPTP
ncbi:MAG: antibiotic biosynthesis monooxygenase [Bernardetiaceae bacterium]|nr:antibiotic biosynthesis monooxygenase [Bernardetiaceae bacterium]